MVMSQLTVRIEELVLNQIIMVRIEHEDYNVYQ